jgi:hypothetical protein
MEIFDEGSIGEVFRFSKGYPRLINIICDHALLSGFIKSAEAVTAAIVRDCAADLTLPQRDVLQAEIAKTERRPPPPLPAALRESGPAAPAPRRNRWQRSALLVALLAALLLGLFGLYPQGFERLKTLWHNQFQGMTAGTGAPPPTQVAPEPPPPAGAPGTPPLPSPKPPATPAPETPKPPAASAAAPQTATPLKPVAAPPPVEPASAGPQTPGATAAGIPTADGTPEKPLPAASVKPQPPPATPEEERGAQNLGPKDAREPLPAQTATEDLPREVTGTGSDPGDIIDWVLEKNKRRQ